MRGLRGSLRLKPPCYVASRYFRSRASGTFSAIIGYELVSDVTLAIEHANPVASIRPAHAKHLSAMHLDSFHRGIVFGTDSRPRRIRGYEHRPSEGSRCADRKYADRQPRLDATQSASGCHGSLPPSSNGVEAHHQSTPQHTAKQGEEPCPTLSQNSDAFKAAENREEEAGALTSVDAAAGVSVISVSGSSGKEVRFRESDCIPWRNLYISAILWTRQH